MATTPSQRISAILRPLFGPDPDLRTIITAFALGAIGAIVLPSSARFLSWFRLHFLYRSKIARYNHVKTISAGSDRGASSTKSTSSMESVDINQKSNVHKVRPWALVTGASDGIGAGFVSELARHDFNIILHGRNPTKLAAQIAKLQIEFPHLLFESWIADATARGEAWDKAFSELKTLMATKDVYLTVLVNNIGGNPDPDKSFTTLSRYEAGDVDALIDMNVTFPSRVTRALLPDLVANKPSLILNMSSAVAKLPMPYLALYAGSKAFDLQFSRSLRLEMMAEGHEDVEVLGVTAARVRSAGSGEIPVDWTTPSSADFARNALRMVGCGRGEVCGWWGHDVQLSGMSLLPEWMAEWITVLVSRQEKKTREQGKQ